jgi:ABC-2 type transport system ATP-binding protein
VEGAAIDARGVSKRYGAVQALVDVTVAIDAPATGLLGANGAGKTTLMRALLGLVRPDAGRLSVLGLDVSRHGASLRRRLGYMPEHECLPRGMTAADLVVHLAELRGLPRRVAVLRASEVLFQVGLEEERSRLIGTFSTGMRQRVKLAQALVHGPELVVLDEPTNGLDPSGRQEMLSLVRRLSAELDVRVLLSTHVLEDVTRTCDAVVLLRDGTVVTAGSIDALSGAAAASTRVRVSGDAERFRGALLGRGLEAAPRDGFVIVAGADAATLDGIRDAAAEAGVGLRELAPDVATLEDVLVGALAGEGE